ncbi:tetrahydrodipicolinate N-succinyltransferase N-terminal domain-containing protein [Aliarcobacter lanthieri]|uniref:tetrahydrodipicolinate N-succinyltransferase N-terminal domain-containing protein n=1 Tax=Aliarcobacter lanthieri TaxID=1355374 RepID=UPI003AAEDE0B
MVTTKDDFKNLVEDIKRQSWYKEPIAFAIARVNRGILDRNKILEVTYPTINWNENSSSAAIFLNAIKQSGVAVDTTKSEAVFDLSDSFLSYCVESYKPFYEEKDKHKNLQVISTLASLPIESGLNADDFKVVFIFEDSKPQSIETSYLKLYVKYNKKIENINLDGIEDLLTTCAWIDGVPVELDWLRQNEILLKVADKYPKVEFVGKYPRFLKHIIPSENETYSFENLLK